MSAIQIAENDNLLRRIHPDQIKIENGRQRPASAAFKNTTNTSDMSVNIEKLLAEREDLLAKHRDRGYRLARFQARLAFSLNQTIVHTPNDESLSHGDVVGEKTTSIGRQFAMGAELI